RARFELCARVARALAAASRARPLVVVVDDLQWADEGSLFLLEFLAPELGSLPLLVVATLREPEPPSDARRAALLAAVQRLGTSVPLAGLARPAVAELLADRLGHAPGDVLAGRALDITGGNPFFVIELAHLLATRGPDASLHEAAAAVAPGVHELLRQRLDPLAPASLRLLPGPCAPPCWLFEPGAHLSYSVSQGGLDQGYVQLSLSAPFTQQVDLSAVGIGQEFTLEYHMTASAFDYAQLDTGLTVRGRDPLNPDSGTYFEFTGLTPTDNPVPEPGRPALLVAGAAVLAGLRPGRRHSRRPVARTLAERRAFPITRA
ncbi:MAG TPA: AAA family ATPase, partial [Myxococcota bacterium]|nr:AAA family ATPase [Myxococcota bacterium]